MQQENGISFKEGIVIDVISPPDKTRAAIAIIFPICLPLLLTIGLLKSGHSPLDYINLLRSGELSLVRQGIGWVAAIAIASIYWKSAFRTLSSSVYFAVVNQELIIPNGQRINTSEISKIVISRGLFQRNLLVVHRHGRARTSINFAKSRIKNMRERLAKNALLAQALIV